MKVWDFWRAESPESRQFKQLKNNLYLAYKGLQIVVDTGQYRDLKKLLIQLEDAHKKVKEYFKPFLVDGVSSELFSDDEVRSLRQQVIIITQEKVKLETELQRLGRENLQQSEDFQKEINRITREKHAFIEREVRLEETLKAQNQLIESLHCRLNDSHKTKESNAEQELQKRCFHLENIIEESRANESKTFHKLEKALTECEALKLQLESCKTKEGFSTTQCYKPPDQVKNVAWCDTNAMKNLQETFQQMTISCEEIASQESVKLQSLQNELGYRNRIIEETQQKLTLNERAIKDLQKYNTSLISKNAALEKLQESYTQYSNQPQLFEEIQHSHIKLQERCKQFEHNELTYVAQIQKLQQELQCFANLDQKLKALETDYAHQTNYCNKLEQIILDAKKEESKKTENLQERLNSYQEEITNLHKVIKNLKEKPQQTLQIFSNDVLSSNTSKKPNKELDEYQTKTLARINAVNAKMNDIAVNINNLRYNRDEKVYLDLQELLIRCVLELDDIESRGSKVICSQRRSCVEKVQELLKTLERFK